MNDRKNCATFTEVNFQDEVINCKKPVLAVFEADWSGTCDIMTPIMENLCVKFEGRVKIGMINIDSNRRLSDDYRINRIPALFFFNDGEIVDHINGLVPGQIITHKLNHILSLNNK